MINGLKSDKSREGFYEGIRYIIVGVTTTLINIGIYQGLLFLGIDYKVSNIFAVILCKVYGYFANKLVVFRSHCNNFRELIVEMIKFVLARGFSGVVDYFGLILAVEVFHFDKIICKYVICVLVIVINYVMGKYIVFRTKNDAIV